MTTTAATATPPIQDQVPALLGLVAGYVGHRTVGVGMRSGLITALSEADTPMEPTDLADRLGLDAEYVAVWCRAALAAGICDREAGTTADAYRLAPHLGTLLLDAAHPAYLGGVFSALERPEVFDGFEDHLRDGGHMWWADCSPAWIEAVAATGAPFYTRLIPAGLEQVPGLAGRLAAGCRVMDSACGSGAGLVRLARTYPRCRIVGVDGDEHSLRRAADLIDAAGLSGSCHLLASALEDLAVAEQVGLVINNISMHECRDIDRATARLAACVEPGGFLVISDFPFPDTTAGLRTPAGRVMSGIQLFEAQIGDQLLPRSAYPDLLHRHGFRDIHQFDLSPVHTVTAGRRPDR